MKIEKLFDGYIISREGEYRPVYYAGMRKGRPAWVVDYAHAKRYRTEDKAQKIIDAFRKGKRVEG